MMKKIQMVDLKGQYAKIKNEMLESISGVLDRSIFINGEEVMMIEEKLSLYNNSKYCVACGNGTDALQIAMMALGLVPGDEVIMPAFTYIATVETAALLNLKLVLVDIDASTFTISIEGIENAITPKTKAIVVVHLFGQIANMEGIMALAKRHNLAVIEDNAQSIGAEYTFSNREIKKAGTIGHIGTTSFFPSKNLGCYGDGGALFTQDAELEKKIRMIANHGQEKKYYHDIIGINSRLDTLQAGILNVKIKYLSEYIISRQQVAAFYYEKLRICKQITLPIINNSSTHVFHQFSILINKGDRDKFKAYLESKNIPSMVYYPIPVHFQKAYTYLDYTKGDFPVSEDCAKRIISLPMHTELELDQLEYICESIINYFND